MLSSPAMRSAAGDLARSLSRAEWKPHFAEFKHSWRHAIYFPRNVLCETPRSLRPERTAGRPELAFVSPRDSLSSVRAPIIAAPNRRARSRYSSLEGEYRYRSCSSCEVHQRDFALTGPRKPSDRSARRVIPVIPFFAELERVGGYCRNWDGRDVLVNTFRIVT